MTTFKWFKNHLDVVKRWRAVTQRPSLPADLEFWISKPGVWSPTRLTILQFRNITYWNNWLHFSIQGMRIAKRCNYVTKDKKEKSMYWVHFSIQFNSAHYTHQSLGSIMESLDNSVALFIEHIAHRSTWLAQGSLLFTHFSSAVSVVCWLNTRQN